MRLNKYIAQSGVASRRKADEFITNGNVKINGQTIKEHGYQVVDGDTVQVNGRAIAPAEKKIYIMLHKPKGYVTTTDDEKNRLTVMELVNDIPERIFPIGRLDYNTTGLLLMTNDGELANKLAHPKNEIGKTYHAEIRGILSKEKLNRLRKGVDIGGFITSPAEVRLIKEKGKAATVEITIHEGKNRQVRKMFKTLECPVQSLKRVSVGDLYLGRIMEGHYRKLKIDEIEYLKNL